MNCSKCGNVLKSGANFCNNCGTPVASQNNISNMQQSNNNQIVQPCKKRLDFIGKYH